MTEQKTKPTEESVTDFIGSLEDETVRDDCKQLIKMMKKATGAEPKLWKGGIVGFGKYHYKYASGHEGYSCLTGFAPRKEKLSLYVMLGIGEDSKLREKLGKHKAGKGCLYVKTLSDVDTHVLESLIKESVSFLKKRYPGHAKHN